MYPPSHPNRSPPVEVFIMRTGNAISHGGFSKHTTVAGLATITAYLHNHIYTTITLILSNPNKTLLKINQTMQKGLLSSGSNQTLASWFLPQLYPPYKPSLWVSSVKQGEGKNSVCQLGRYTLN